MPLIFQYGSNTDAARLNDKTRLAGAAEDLGRAQTVGNYEIAFNKWSQKNSYAAADLLKHRKGGRRCWGVLYQLSRAGFKKLKEIEGRSYRAQLIAVESATGVVQRATTFRVRQARRQKDRHTSADYVRHIVDGLRTHGVEEIDPDYIQYVIDVAIQTNQAATATAAAAEQNRRIEALRAKMQTHAPPVPVRHDLRYEMSARNPIRVGICVRYTTGTFTLAFIEFKKSGDVVLSQHYGDYQKLDDGTKFNPHVTYHADGTYHVAHYKGNRIDGGYAVSQKRQPLNSSFKGFETLVDQAFGRDYAKKFGRPCGYDFPVIIDAESIEDRSDTINDSLGEHTIQLATASFQVDLLEPGLDPAGITIGPPNEELLYRELIKDTFPWCLVTLHRSR